MARINQGLEGGKFKEFLWTNSAFFLGEPFGRKGVPNWGGSLKEGYFPGRFKEGRGELPF